MDCPERNPTTAETATNSDGTELASRIGGEHEVGENEACARAVDKIETKEENPVMDTVRAVTEEASDLDEASKRAAASDTGSTKLLHIRSDAKKTIAKLACSKSGIIYKDDDSKGRELPDGTSEDKKQSALPEAVGGDGKILKANTDDLKEAVRRHEEITSDRGEQGKESMSLDVRAACRGESTRQREVFKTPVSSVLCRPSQKTMTPETSLGVNVPRDAMHVLGTCAEMRDRPEVILATEPTGPKTIDSSQVPFVFLPATEPADTEQRLGSLTTDELLPGAFAVSGPSGTEESPSAAPSERGESSVPLEGRLVEPSRRAEVYDGVALPSEGNGPPRRAEVYDGVVLHSKRNGNGRENNMCVRRKILMVLALFCSVATVIVAVAVTLLRRKAASSNTKLAAITTLANGPIHFPRPEQSLTVEEKLTLQQLEELVGVKVNEVGTPYAAATDWILKEDPMEMTSSSTFLAQRYILALLYFSTGGDHWTTERFLTAEHECTWYGIFCGGGDNFVREIAMMGNNMVGTLPSELAKLPLLQSIDFSRNRLESTVPAEIGWLTHLKELSLFDNHLAGSLPSSIGNLTSLEVLAVANNVLTSTFPDEFYSMGSLRYFAGGYNELSGTISTLIGHLTSLEEWNIEGNSFTGRIPATIGELTNLKAFLTGNSYIGFNNILGNSLTGTIPTTIGNLISLERFAVPFGNLTGTLPENLYNVKNLTEFWCSYNALSGTISTLIGRLTSLKEVDIWGNRFAGTIPATIGKLTNLEWFVAVNNSFSGTVPTEFLKLEKLKFLHLSWNDFTGTISEDFCQLDSLLLFYADCGPSNVTGPPAVECMCCTHCCDTMQRGDIDFWFETCIFMT